MIIRNDYDPKLSCQSEYDDRGPLVNTTVS